MNAAILKPCDANDEIKVADARAGVLLPLPLAGPYDYRVNAALRRGALVVAPLGPREALGVVWNEGEGTIADARLKHAIPLEGVPSFPRGLCDFIDWVAR